MATDTGFSNGKFKICHFKLFLAITNNFMSTRGGPGGDEGMAPIEDAFPYRRENFSFSLGSRNVYDKYSPYTIWFCSKFLQILQ